MAELLHMLKVPAWPHSYKSQQQCCEHMLSQIQQNQSVACAAARLTGGCCVPVLCLPMIQHVIDTEVQVFHGLEDVLRHCQQLTEAQDRMEQWSKSTVIMQPIRAAAAAATAEDEQLRCQAQESLIGKQHQRHSRHEHKGLAGLLDLGAVAQHELVLLHVSQAAPKQLNGGVVLGYHTLTLRDLLTQCSDVDLEVLTLAFKGQHLHNIAAADEARSITLKGGLST